MSPLSVSTASLAHNPGSSAATADADVPPAEFDDHLSFANPSPTPSPKPLPTPSPNPLPGKEGEEDIEFELLDDNQDELESDLVETTSLQAAKAMAKLYNEKEREDKQSYVIRRRVVNGKTVYRIRPRSPTSPQPQDRPPLSPSASTSRLNASSSSSNPGLKGSRSAIALNGSGSVRIIHPDAQGFYRPPGSGTTSSAVPTFALPAGQNASGKMRYWVEEDGDVLGKILGWNSGHSTPTPMPISRSLPQKPELKEEEELAILTPTEATRDTGSASELLTPKLDGGEKTGEKGEDRERRPPLVSRATITPSITAHHGEAATRTSPFGRGVKVGSGWGRDHLGIRETYSYESIRTAKGENGSPQPGVEDGRETKRRRLKKDDDPTVFDVFHSFSPEATATMTPSGSQMNGSRSSVDVTQSEQHWSSKSNIEIPSSFYPGDDPRFVIWGTKLVGSSTAAGLSKTDTLDGDVTVPSKRWSLRDKKPNSSDSSLPSIAASHSTERVLMAATLERVVAEITSKMNSDLLTDWFLTYRCITTPLQLLKLFILRFRWAMMEPSSPEDDSARRIARVRTFVVIRYWLLNFFSQDFLPNKELRTTLTTWLNDVAKDAYIQHNPKDQRLIKSLKKVVKRLKEMYTLLQPAEAADAAKNLTDGNFGGSATVMPMLGRVSESREELSRSSGSGRSSLASDRHSMTSDRDSEIVDDGLEDSLEVLATKEKGASDEEVDLELDLAEATKAPSLDLNIKEPFDLSSTAPTSVPKTVSSRSPSNKARPASAVLLAHTEHRRMGSGSPESPSSTVFRSSPIAGHQPALPFSHSGFSRYLDRTMGTFGRMRRLLGNRGTSSTVAACVNLDAIDDADIGRTQTGDLLYSKAALESYFQFFLNNNQQHHLLTPAEDLSSSSSAPPSSASESMANQSSDSLTTPLDSANEGETPVEVAAASHVAPFEEIPDQTDTPTTPAAKPNTQSLEVGSPELHHSVSTQTIKSEASRRSQIDRVKSFKMPSFGGKSVRQTVQSVQSAIQLDDLDLSDDSEAHGPVKKTLRRLPAASNLRTAGNLRNLTTAPPRDSMDTFSSFGTQRIGKQPASASVVSSEADDDEFAPAPFEISNFVLEGIDSDDSEGDVEAALRRLEGHVDEKKQRNKSRTVDKQMEKSMRVALQSASETDPDETASSVATDDSYSHSRTGSLASDLDVEMPVVSSTKDSDLPEVKREMEIIPQPAPVMVAPTSLSVDANKTGSRVHRESKRRSKISRKTSSQKAFTGPTHPALALARSNMANLPPIHRSFILMYRTEVIAQQFCLIERDLFRAVQWRELVEGTWQERKPLGDITDWEQYLKSQRLAAMEVKSKGEELSPNEVHAMIARFNVVANWVASEIVLTINLDERASLIAKFIRLAWKCYTQYNFQSVTQIVHGLQTTPVERLRRTWRRVPKWETAVYRDLKTFTSHLRNFKGLRTTTAKIAEEWGPLGGQSSKLVASRSSNNISAKAKHTRLGCIPFFGIFLRDLAINSELPSLLDPTSPNNPASVDPTTGQICRVIDPNAFSNLPPLPEGVTLEPLINIHKFRNIATVVQKVLTFQEIAEVYPFEADGSLYITCLKLKCLDVRRLRECSEICEK
ncbi:ras GEF [Atractiella rhizophila]|nr:ras GEF [Atractiella rhizophila]